jgi:hypothetical protein
MPRLNAAPPPPKSRPITAGAVTLDSLTAATHPNAVVTGVLLAVVAALVAVGLAGLIGPVLSLDLFAPDLSLGEWTRSLAQLATSVMALIAAGLGLAKHPRFPPLFLAVAASLTVLASSTLSIRILNGTLSTDLPLFTILSLPVILAVPYVVASKKCRLIFARRFDVNDLRSVTGEEAWPRPSLGSVVPGSPLPTAPKASPPALTPPRRPRLQRASPSTEAAPRRPPPPPPPAPNPALRAALFGAPPASPPPPEPTETDGHSQTTPGKRVGLEALINLRPPGT